MPKLKIGIAGLGAIFPVHANLVSYREDCAITALCDTEPVRLKSYAAAYSAAAYTSFEEMIDNEQLDAVHICTPHYLHAPMSIYALKAGVNVLTEKPMSIHYSDALKMVEAAKQNDVTLGVIFQNRFNAGSQLVKKMLDNGELGKIITARIYVAWSRNDAYYAKSDWKGTWDKEGGGVIINQAIHTFDLMNWFINDEIENIEANLNNRTIKSIEVEDVAEGLIRYKNGTLAAFYAMNYNSFDSPIEVHLHCEKGLVHIIADKASVKLVDGREYTAEIDDISLNQVDTAKSYWGKSHQKQINNFYDSLKAGVKPEITGESVLSTQKMICDIYEKGKYQNQRR